MTSLKRLSLLVIALCLLAGRLPAWPFGAGGQESTAQKKKSEAQEYDVREFGAKGEGQTLDTAAINEAIEAAAAAGGGTVRFPAGTYLSFSIHLKSNITLYLDQGVTIVAADAKGAKGSYDPPEPNEWDKYQDFGHSHWQNGLIWGIGLENVSIIGPGLINGKGLTRGGPRQQRPVQPGDIPPGLTNRPPSARVPPLATISAPAVPDSFGDKAISLKLCRNVLLRDISILNGGHFALLATGVDNLTIDNVKVDTNRDGFDIDACRNVRISNCSVNAPNDDAIVLKTSYALGYARATENVTITNCLVSGYDIGSLLDATYKRNVKQAPDRDGATGRIKFGTESNGDLRNITISNIVFDHCRGLALETVDGAIIEDVAITNITMRDVVNSPIFLRLGSRLRGPAGTPVGQLRRVQISNVVAYDADPRYASIISGIPGHSIENVKLSNIHIFYQGGGTVAQAALSPPEKEINYPEPSMFGEMPAYGFFIRHVKGIELNNVEVRYAQEELRPAFVLKDVNGADFLHVKAQLGKDAFAFMLQSVSDFSTAFCQGVPDMRLERVEQKKF